MTMHLIDFDRLVRHEPDCWRIDRRIAGSIQRSNMVRFKLGADPAAQRAKVEMGEAASRIHSRPTIDESLEVAGDRLVVDIWNVDVESHCPHVLRVQRRP